LAGGAGDDDRYARLDTGLRCAESDARRTTKDEDAVLVKLQGVFRCCGSCHCIYQPHNWKIGLIRLYENLVNPSRNNSREGNERRAASLKIKDCDDEPQPMFLSDVY
jgi:hypothetical protein